MFARSHLVLGLSAVLLACGADDDLGVHECEPGLIGEHESVRWTGFFDEPTTWNAVALGEGVAMLTTDDADRYLRVWDHQGRDERWPLEFPEVYDQRESMDVGRGGELLFSIADRSWLTDAPIGTIADGETRLWSYDGSGAPEQFTTVPADVEQILLEPSGRIWMLGADQLEVVEHGKGQLVRERGRWVRLHDRETGTVVQSPIDDDDAYRRLALAPDGSAHLITIMDAEFEERWFSVAPLTEEGLGPVSWQRTFGDPTPQNLYILDGGVLLIDRVKQTLQRWDGDTRVWKTGEFRMGLFEWIDVDDSGRALVVLHDGLGSIDGAVIEPDGEVSFQFDPRVELGTDHAGGAGWGAEGTAVVWGPFGCDDADEQTYVRGMNVP